MVERTTLARKRLAMDSNANGADEMNNESAIVPAGKSSQVASLVDKFAGSKSSDLATTPQKNFIKKKFKAADGEVLQIPSYGDMLNGSATSLEDDRREQ